MEKVMVFGTFDIVHPGHVFFLKKAKRYGDYLVVVIARDITVKNVKGRFPEVMELRRKENIEKLEIADEVILGSLGDKYRIIEKIKPDIICLGYDQLAFTDDLRKELRARNLLIDIYRMGAFQPHKFKSSKLRTNPQ